MALLPVRSRQRAEGMVQKSCPREWSGCESWNQKDSLWVGILRGQGEWNTPWRCWGFGKRGGGIIRKYARSASGKELRWRLINSEKGPGLGNCQPGSISSQSWCSFFLDQKEVTCGSSLQARAELEVRLRNRPLCPPRAYNWREREKIKQWMTYAAQ